ncbi:hypothetical protein D1007_43286 [Hordeum vulgare]|nr:hypothetical protein D1007_62326 [Hordeum vulgare]KAE8783248.1 hypothetical protein D1007_43286 [Hordeum vulgare]
MRVQETIAYEKLKSFCANIMKKLAPPLLREVQASNLMPEAEPFTPKQTTRAAKRNASASAVKHKTTEKFLLQALRLIPEDTVADKAAVQELQQLFNSPLRVQHVSIITALFRPSLDNFSYLPKVETRGGVLLAWDTTILSIDPIQLDANFLTGRVHNTIGFHSWMFVAYVPQGDEPKSQFLLDLYARRELCLGLWVLVGDFNMILWATEKNNTNINRGMMGKFQRFVDDHELKELYTHGRTFTWSNERNDPNLIKIDRVLVLVD